MLIPGTIHKAYSDALFDIIHPSGVSIDDLDYNPDRALKIIVDRFLVLAEVNELEHEINRVLNRLGVEGGFITEHYSLEELVIGVKFYLISWSAMKDVMTNLINKSLDLGMDDKDVSFGVVIRNKKVQASQIPKIIKCYAKSLDVQFTDKQRNDVAHRGKLLDEDINAFQKKYSQLYSRKYSLLSIESITDDEFKEELNSLNVELKKLVCLKKESYKQHFKTTIELNTELASELGRITAKEILKAE